MNKLSGDHPSVEILAEFAEGRSANPAALEAHLDTCEACARQVLAGREAIAIEALGPDEIRMDPDIDTRARRALLSVVRTKAPSADPPSQLGAIGTFGLLAGFAGFGSVTAGSDFALAGNHHPEETPADPEKTVGDDEISEPDALSDVSDEEISRMLDHIQDILSEGTSDDPTDSTDQTAFTDAFSAPTDPLAMPEIDVPPIDFDDDFDHGSTDEADHHEDPLDQYDGGDDVAFHG